MKVHEKKEGVLVSFLMLWRALWPKITWGRKGLLHLTSVIKGNQSRSSRQKPGSRNWSRDHEGPLRTGLLHLARPVCFPLHLRTPCFWLRHHPRPSLMLYHSFVKCNCWDEAGKSPQGFLLLFLIPACVSALPQTRVRLASTDSKQKEGSHSTCEGCCQE